MRENITITRKLRVPDLIGLPMRNAALVLKTAGFPPPDIKYAESYEPRLNVIGQSPSKGEIVNSDLTIQLTVSQRSLIHFLPGIYQRDDPQGGNVLRDFLWVFRHLLDDVDHTIDNIHQHFDPYEAPAEFLPWLASWIAFTLDDNWPESKKRYLIKRAMDFYRIRGTVRGVQLWLELFTGTRPTIIENEWPFRGFQIGVHSTIAIDSVILPPVNTAHCFIVEFPIDPDDITDELIIRIHDIIQAQKPAHSTYFLRFRDDHSKLTSFAIVIGEHAVGVGMEIVTAESDAPAVTQEEDVFIEEDEMDFDF